MQDLMMLLFDQVVLPQSDYVFAVYQRVMLSPTEKKGSPKPTLKNPKLASMASIANRSPLNKNEPKEAITNITLSKKQSIEGGPLNSPRASTSYAPHPLAPPQDIPPKRAISKQEEKPQPLIQTRGRSPDPIKSSTKGGKVEGNKTINLPNGDRYEGALMGGLYHGQGAYTFREAGLRYEGEFSQGRPHSYGTLMSLETREAIYEGSWQAGLKHGEGRFAYAREEYYNGEWANDQKHGAGIYTFPGGTYNGAWARNRREGKGSLKLASGAEFKGTFQDNQFVKGFVKYANGDEYSGQMRNNRRVGDDGSYMEAASKIRYRGGWFNDRRHGRGTLTYDNGDELTGTFENGSLTEEHVVMYKWRDGSVFNGWFRNNQPNKGSVTHANSDKWEI